MRRMDDTEPFFSPRRTRMLSMGLPALSASVTALRPAMTSLSLSFSMNKPIPFRGFRTRLRPKFAILSQYIVDYSILIFAIATETRNLARFCRRFLRLKPPCFWAFFRRALFVILTVLLRVHFARHNYSFWLHIFSHLAVYEPAFTFIQSVICTAEVYTQRAFHSVFRLSCGKLCGKC